jgi:hypothetical protein
MKQQRHSSGEHKVSSISFAKEIQPVNGAQNLTLSPTMFLSNKKFL